MVEAARSRLSEAVLFDAVAETRACLPDAVQLLTSCTIGNGWLKVLNLGRFALSLYDKYQVEGIRVNLDPAMVKDFPEIAN
jgi:formylmethanofuran dehydrogenase subunit E